MEMLSCCIINVQETSKSNEELTQNMIDTQSESQKLQQEISSEQAKLLHMSAQKGELEQHLEVRLKGIKVFVDSHLPHLVNSSEEIHVL